MKQHVSPVANQHFLSPLTFKMAPWPEQGNEPKAPDKNDKCEHITSLDELNSKADGVDNSEYIVQTSRGDQV